MANQKQVHVINSIRTLYEKEWPKLRIARELGIDVKTVRRYIRELEAEQDAGAPEESKSLFPPTGTGAPKSLIPPPGKSGSEPGRRSQCEPFRRRILEALEDGLTAQRIHQDLVAEEGFGGGYDAVKRFCRRLKAADPKRIWRMECLPGEEAQVDFGTGYYLEGAKGKRRKAQLLRVVLSHSRKSYTEAVAHQDTERFIRCLENAFRHFGGVPQTLCIDNLRAAVTKADWYEPELNPKIESFCRHYGTVVLPCRVRHPEHKGKVENSVGYVKDNALKGRVFASLAKLNEHLQHWERTVADLRIHGTTRRQVRAHFEQVEKPALGPLPPDLFPCFSEGERLVHRDSYVQLQNSYYEVPAEYIGQQVWVRWNTRTVRIFNQRFEQIAVLARLQQGQFSECLGARGRPHQDVEREKAYWLSRCARIGDQCGLWALEVLAQRGPTGIRTLQGLRQLSSKHSAHKLDEACAQALSHGAYRLRDLRRLLEQPSRQQTLPFMDNHPLIRDMREYTAFLEQLHPQPMEETLP
jgi:transposase